MRNSTEKKGALELSISTIVVIVIGMAMLVLGLVLVRTIFTGTTKNIGQLNDKVRDEITKLFPDEGKDVVVYVTDGSSTIKVKPGEIGDAGIGIRTVDGSAVTTRNRIQYKLSLDTADSTCRNANTWLTPEVDIWSNVDEYSGSSTYSLVKVNVPKGTAKCLQKVNIDVRDGTTQENFGGTFFYVDVLKSGLLS